MKILLKAGLKKQKMSIISVGILFMLMTIAIVISISLGYNARNYIPQEMDRVGYGDETVWIHTNSSEQEYDQTIAELSTQIEGLEEVESVQAQKLIFAGYSVQDMHSDGEGQILQCDASVTAYRFLNKDATGYQKVNEIEKGTIFISPSTAETYDASIGDTITFQLSRDGATAEFRIAGFFEDPFMGSSMIEMKSFLVGSEDFNNITKQLKKIDTFQLLARTGAMLHINQTKDSEFNTTELSGLIQSQTEVGKLIDFSYSKQAIEGFMLILQNIMVGFLLVFAAVLGFIGMLITSHSITNALEQDCRDMGILKTVGSDSSRLRWLQMIQYAIGESIGTAIGFLLAIWISNIIAEQMVRSNGLLIPGRVVVIPSLLFLTCLILISMAFIYLKTQKISRITPLHAIRRDVGRPVQNAGHLEIREGSVLFSLAIRQVRSDRKKYIGIILVSMILVFLVVVVGKMNQWLGRNGEGLMNSFSVAEHDIGVEPNHRMNMAEVEDIIEQYADIEDTYELAMQSGMVNETAYTINVLDEPEWFHIIKGRTCQTESEILVTENVASDLGLSIGDNVTAGTSMGTAEYTVAGIYACANEMGANVGMNREGYARIGNVNDDIWCTHYILSNSKQNETIMQELQKQYPMDLDVHTNSWSGLSGIVRTMHLLTYMMYLIVLIVIVVVVNLTSSKFIQSEQRNMAIYKSIGFTDQNLRISFSTRFGITALIGTVAGILLSGVLADLIIRFLLSSFGITDFHVSFSIINNIVLAIMIWILFIGISYLYTKRIQNIDITELVKEI